MKKKTYEEGLKVGAEMVSEIMEINIKRLEAKIGLLELEIQANKRGWQTFNMVRTEGTRRYIISQA